LKGGIYLPFPPQNAVVVLISGTLLSSVILVKALRSMLLYSKVGGPGTILVM